MLSREPSGWPKCKLCTTKLQKYIAQLQIPAAHFHMYSLGEQSSYGDNADNFPLMKCRSLLIRYLPLGINFRSFQVEHFIRSLKPVNGLFWGRPRLFREDGCASISFFQDGIWYLESEKRGVTRVMSWLETSWRSRPCNAAQLLLPQASF